MSDDPFDIRTGLVPTRPRDLATRSASLARRGLEALRARGTRIVQFPTEWSLGTLDIRDRHEEHGKWDEFGEARGEVVVPMGKALRLWVTVEDISQLAALQPADIQDLLLYGTRITDAGLAHLRGLTALESLDLRGQAIGDHGLMHLRGLTRLRSLWLSLTQVTDAGLVHLRGLTALESLDLRGQSIGDRGLVHLRGPVALKSLDLSDTRVGDRGLVHLRGLRSLESLNLAGTNVRGEGLLHLSGLRRLWELDLSRTDLSGESLVHLSGLTSLALLDLSLISGAAASDWRGFLEAAVPQCFITWGA